MVRSHRGDHFPSVFNDTTKLREAELYVNKEQPIWTPPAEKKQRKKIEKNKKIILAVSGFPELYCVSPYIERHEKEIY